MTNDDVVFRGDYPTNDMHKSGGVQGATDHGNGQRRTPSMTSIIAAIHYSPRNYVPV